MFSPFQKKLISGALAGLAFLVLIAIVVGTVMLAAKFIGIFNPVIWPLIIAMLLALLLQPVCDFLENQLRFPRPAAIASIFVFLLLILAGILFWLIPMIGHQISELIHRIPALWAQLPENYPELANWIKERLEEGGIVERIYEDAQFGVHLKALATAALSKLLYVFGKAEVLFSQITAAAVIPIYFYYLINERRDLIGKFEREFSAVIPKKIAADIAFLMRQFRDIVVAFFRGQFVVVTIYGIILATGFFFAGLPGAVLFGLGLGYLNMIPYFGTVVGLCAVLPLAFFSGGIWMLVWVTVVFIVAQLIESYWLTPKIMGKYTGLHPMTIIASIFFWSIALDGILGMILAVPLTAFFTVFWRLLKERYLTKAASFPANN